MSAGIQLRLEPFGFGGAETAIRGIMFRGGHLKVPFEAFGRYLVGQTHQHFRAEASPEGVPWKALSREYVERPKKRGGRGGREHPILLVHGWLEQSITYKADDTAVAIGTNRKFPGGEKSAAAIHQLGGQAGRGHSVTIPARPFLGVTRNDTDRIGELLIEYLGKL